MAHALRHPGYEYTIESHARSRQVVYQTAHTDLLGPVELGMPRRVKVGKSFRFNAVSLLEDILDRQPACPLGSGSDDITSANSIY